MPVWMRGEEDVFLTYWNKMLMSVRLFWAKPMFWHKIDLTQDVPIKQKTYIVFPAKLTIQKELTEEMLAADIIENTGSDGVTVQKVEKRLWRACKKREELLGRKNGRICCFLQRKVDCVGDLLSLMD